MFKRLRSSLLISALGLMAFVMSGCGGDGNGSGATGPASASSFAGSSIDFNPTVNFSTGNNLTYLNTEAGSPFPAAAVNTPGTYTYVPNATFTAGTLTLNVDGIVDPIVLEISNFTRSGTNVTGFTATAGGQNYPVTVTGALPAYQQSSGGGGAGESRADDIPSAMQGTYDLTFEASGTAAVSGVPDDGTTTTFVIGARSLTFDGRTLTNPIFYNDNQFEWIFKDGSVWWAVSGSDTGLNEINVQGPYTTSGNIFYGQYSEQSSSGSLSVDGDGKYSDGSTFSALVNSISETSIGSPYSQTPQLRATVFFTVLTGGSLQVSYGSDGVFSSFTAPFETANSTTITYHLTETGTPNKDYTVVITKNAQDQPTAIDVTLKMFNLVRETTHTYGLIPQN